MLVIAHYDYQSFHIPEYGMTQTNLRKLTTQKSADTTYSLKVNQQTL